MVNRFHRLARQALVFPAILAFLAVSTVALAHRHSDTKSVDGSPCAMCLATHSATHLVVTPIITLHFTGVHNPLLVAAKSSLLALEWPAVNRDRAPPSL